MKLIFDVSDKPKAGQLVVFALQQMLAILAATIAVPLIIGKGLTPAAAMFVSFLQKEKALCSLARPLLF